MKQKYVCADTNENETMDYHMHLSNRHNCEFRQNNNDNNLRITYYGMSWIIIFFVNPIFGVVGLFFSIQSQRHLNAAFEQHAEKRLRLAKNMGSLALVMNMIGIVSTMACLIFIFVRFSRIEYIV